MRRKSLTILGHYPVPEIIQSAVTAFTTPYSECSRKLRHDAGVDTERLLEQSAVICDGYCCWHDDAHLLNYSLLYVARNDTDSFVETRGVKIPSQPVGTLLLLDVRKKHRLNCPGGMQSDTGVWFAFCWDYHHDAPCIEECTGRLMRFFADVKRYES